MMIRVLIFVSLLMTAGCGNLRDPAPIPLLSIPEGTYAASVGDACVSLEFARRERTRYLVDADCDGSAEARFDDVVVEEDVIRVEGAEMIVTAVGDASFSGIWVTGAGQSAVRFERVEG